MPDTPIYKFTINVPNPEGITLKSIVGSPRVYKPQDLLTACQNLDITVEGSDVDPMVSNLVRYLVSDFFVMAHRTGLYNRQKGLWESLSRVCSVDVWQHSQGVFKRKQLPIFDLTFNDYKQRALVLMLLVDPKYRPQERTFVTLLKRLIARVGKLGGQSVLAGAFYCAGKPIPARVFERVSALTDARDPVGRYESLLPEPVRVPLDVLEIDAALGEDPANYDVRLAHPDLATVKRPRAAVVNETDA